MPLLLSTLLRADEKTSYEEQVLPIFERACLNCHNPDKTKGGLDLSSFSATIKGSSGGKIVEPGDLGSSLIAVVEQSAEPKMPPEGDPLPKNQIDILKKWIQGGLLENKDAKARKPTKPTFQAAVRSDPAAKPEGPPPMPADLLLEPTVATKSGSAVHSVAASPWAPLIAITSQHQVLLHHSETLQLAGILPFPDGDPVSLAFTPDARYLIVGGGVPGKSGFTVTFDVTTGSRLLTAGREFDSILAADISPGFDRVATGGPSRVLKIWDSTSGEPVASVKKHSDWITALDISPDGVLLASGDRNGGVWVWESDSGSEFHTLRGHQAAITASCFRADSNILATASEDGSVRFWEMNGGSEVKKSDAHNGGVTAFCFARDGSSLSTGRDLKAKLWKPDFNLARELSAKLPALPTAAALSADGKRAFIGDVNGAVHVIDADNGQLLGTLPSNPPTIDARLANIAGRIKEIEASEEAPEQKQAALAGLERSRKHWQAAAINSRSIQARQVAAESDARCSGAQLDFTAAAAELARQAETLNAKRTERRRFANTSPGAGHADEHAATLAAIDISVARELDAYQQFENRLAELKRSLDPLALASHQHEREAETLETSYRAALK